jgi:hypothetical protein
MIEEVVSFTPAGHVITFENLAKAKRLLLNQYHHHIVEDMDDFMRKYTLDQMSIMFKHTLKLNTTGNPQVGQWVRLTDKREMAQILWPMLIAHGRRAVDSMFNKNITDKVLLTHDLYLCDYEPGQDPIRDINYTQTAHQEQVLINMFIDQVKPTGKIGVPEYALRKMIEKLVEDGILITKQGGWKVFWYYRSHLLAKGFITIIKKGGL